MTLTNCEGISGQMGFSASTNGGEIKPMDSWTGENFLMWSQNRIVFKRSDRERICGFSGAGLPIFGSGRIDLSDFPPDQHLVSPAGLDCPTCDYHLQKPLSPNALLLQQPRGRLRNVPADSVRNHFRSI